MRTRAYKFRIYPNQAQQESLRRTIGACRWVYNHYLEQRKNHYLDHKETLKYKDMSTDLTKLRREVEWLGTVQLQPLQQAQRALDTAYNRFFHKKARFPRFKSKKDSRQSFRRAVNWSLRGSKLSIQTDIQVRTRGRLPPSGVKLGTLTISVTSTGKWYASIVTTQAVELAPKYSDPIGIDLGLADLAITSDGKKYENIHPQRRRLKRLKHLQQSLARKQGGSNRRAKAKLEVARLHAKIANQRLNHLHQVSSAITSKNHALIAVEDLAIKNMLGNRRLSRSISDVSWSELLRQLQYKQSWRGGEFVKVDRFFPSSKTCSACGFIVDKLPLNVRRWTCPSCGIEHDRDVNAAKNILKQAGVQLGVESTESKPSDRPMVTGSEKRGDSTVSRTLSNMPERI